MTPLAEGKKRIKLTLDPTVYEAFSLLCRSRRIGRPSRMVEVFMRACLKNPAVITLILKIAREE